MKMIDPIVIQLLAMFLKKMKRENKNYITMYDINHQIPNNEELKSKRIEKDLHIKSALNSLWRFGYISRPADNVYMYHGTVHMLEELVKQLQNIKESKNIMDLCSNVFSVDDISKLDNLILFDAMATEDDDDEDDDEDIDDDLFGDLNNDIKKPNDTAELENEESKEENENISENSVEARLTKLLEEMRLDFPELKNENFENNGIEGKDEEDEEVFEDACSEVIVQIVSLDKEMDREGAIDVAEQMLEKAQTQGSDTAIKVYERVVKEFGIASDDEYSKLSKLINITEET